MALHVHPDPVHVARAAFARRRRRPGRDLRTRRRERRRRRRDRRGVHARTRRRRHRRAIGCGRDVEATRGGLRDMRRYPRARRHRLHGVLAVDIRVAREADRAS